MLGSEYDNTDNMDVRVEATLEALFLSAISEQHTVSIVLNP